MASLDEAPFGALDLCVEGYGESRALRILDDYLSMSEVDFARYDRRLPVAILCFSLRFSCAYPVIAAFG